MDIEALIRAVYKRRPVWDRRDKLHFNRNTVEKCWIDISSEMNVDENALRKKWKYLRDQYSVELGKITANRNEDAEGSIITSKWSHFNLLHFLEGIVKPRLTSDKIKEFKDDGTISSKFSDSYSHKEYENNGNDLDHKGMIKTVLIDENNTYNSSSTSVGTSDRKRRKYVTGDTCSEDGSNSEKQKLELQRRDDSDDDEDLLFFKSLLPFVRKIPLKRKLTFRSRVQDLVDEFAFKQKCYFSWSSAPSIYSSSSNNSNNST